MFLCRKICNNKNIWSRSRSRSWSRIWKVSEGVVSVSMVRSRSWSRMMRSRSRSRMMRPRLHHFTYTSPFSKNSKSPLMQSCMYIVLYNFCCTKGHAFIIEKQSMRNTHSTWLTPLAVVCCHRMSSYVLILLFGYAQVFRLLKITRWIRVKTRAEMTLDIFLARV